jgi:peptidoglycan/xylan/chitin deacetylase (PgdA/CDA1 family)
MSAARNLARGIAESMIVRSGVAGLMRRRLRGQAVVLAYHNIVPTGTRRAGESSLHLPQAQFAKHLDVIASTARVVPLASLFDDHDDDARRVAITFDDAYAGAVTAGLDELRRRSLPATIFVAPGLLGGDVWWDRLAEANRGVMSDEVRQHAIHDLRGDRGEVVQWFAAHGGASRSSDELPRIADESELAKAAAQAGITFGAHSWSHRNLSALSAAELDAELSRPLEWLGSRYANVVPWMAYPYGIASPAVEAAAERAGLRGAFMVSGGWLDRRSARPQALPRISVAAGLSPNGLSLRLAGIGSNR